MVIREETVLQVKSKVSQMEKSSDMNIVQEYVGAPLHSSAPVSRSKRESNSAERMNACMANNLFHSVFKGRFRKIKLILDRGYNVNNKNNYGYSVLIAALHIDDETKRDKMFRYLINKNADVTVKDPKHQRSVLSWAALLGRNAQVILILEILNGDYDLKEQDNDGMTCIHHATQAGHTDVVRTLVQEFRRFRLSVDIPDKLGLTPYLHAKRLGYSEISNILHKEGKACPGQSDSFTFRNSNEWSDIGNNIKQKQHMKQRLTNLERAAIYGSSKSFRDFYQSEKVPSISLSVPQDYTKPEKLTYWVVRNAPSKFSSDNHNQLVTRSEQFAERHQNKYKVRQGTSRSNPNPSLSLLDMTPGGKPVSAHEFKSSEIDTTKIVAKDAHNSQKGHHVQPLVAIFAALSDQQTTSYRQTVRSTPSEEQNTPRKAKRSTFSIIFGKDADRKRKKKGKESAKSSRTDKKKSGTTSKFLKPPSRK